MLYKKYHDCIYIDCTAKKNNLFWPLIIAVGVNQENKTIVLGQALLVDETAKSFEFFLQSLCYMNDTEKAVSILYEPSVIWTDEDTTFLKAQRSIVPNARGFRCDWHFNKDIIKKLTSLHLKDGEPHKILRKFHEVSHSETEPRFNIKWTEFLLFIGDYNNPNLKSYFEHQYKTRERWAHFHRLVINCLGSNSTQRVEIMNAVIGRVCNTKTGVLDLVKHLEDMAITVEDKSLNIEYGTNNKIMMEIIKSVYNNNSEINDIKAACETNFSKYATNQILQELSSSHKFDTTFIENMKGSCKFKVQLSRTLTQNANDYESSKTVMWIPTNGCGKWICPCPTACKELFCRHILAIIFKETKVSAPFNIGIVGDRWRLTPRIIHPNIYIKRSTDVEMINDLQLEVDESDKPFDYSQFEDSNSNEFQSPQSKSLLSTARNDAEKRDPDTDNLKKRAEFYNDTVRRVSGMISTQLDRLPLRMVEEFWDKFIRAQYDSMEVIANPSRQKTSKPSQLAVQFNSKKKGKKK